MEYYIPISRRLFEHQLWCEERIYSRFEAWLDLIQSARFEDTKQLIGNRFIEGPDSCFIAVFSWSLAVVYKEGKFILGSTDTGQNDNKGNTKGNRTNRYNYL